jgi:hypothetical protein
MHYLNAAKKNHLNLLSFKSHLAFEFLTEKSSTNFYSVESFMPCQLTLNNDPLVVSCNDLLLV